MNRLLNYFRLVKLYSKAPMHLAWYKILKSIVDFATDVNQNKKPMLTKIAVVDFSEDKLLGDFDLVSLWAGVGNANPIERIGHLRNQIDLLKTLLKECVGKMEVGKDDDLVININLVLKTFE